MSLWDLNMLLMMAISDVTQTNGDNQARCCSLIMQIVTTTPVGNLAVSPVVLTRPAMFAATRDYANI